MRMRWRLVYCATGRGPADGRGMGCGSRTRSSTHTGWWPTQILQFKSSFLGTSIKHYFLYCTWIESSQFGQASPAVKVWGLAPCTSLKNLNSFTPLRGKIILIPLLRLRIIAVQSLQPGAGLLKSLEDGTTTLSWITHNFHIFTRFL